MNILNEFFLRIALLTDGIWPFVVGGMQKHSFYLCKYFARKGVYVELFHTSDMSSGIDLNTVFTEEELKYIRAWYIPKPQSDKLPGHYTRAAYKYSENIFKKLVEVLQIQPDIDFVYAKGLTGWYLLKNRSRLNFSLPIAINVHGYEYFQKAASLKHKLEQYLLIPAFTLINKKADFIFSYGGKISDIIKKNIKNSASRIIEVPTGIEVDFLINELRPTTGIRRFVFIGRNERRKGVFEINSAIRKLSEKEEFEFHFIGDIPSESRIESPGIIYHGVLKDRESITNVMQSSDVLVCPSYSEGMPNVILEGMASGCAIIASDVGAVNIQVGEENGWLIEPGSISSLEDAMLKALRIKEKDLNILRLNSVAKVKEKFLWENVIEMKIDAIQKIISNRTGV